MERRKYKAVRQQGSTLLELVVSVALMTGLMGSVILCLNTGQKSFRRSEIGNALNQQLRAAQQLLTQDITQAGLNGTAAASDYVSTTSDDNPTSITTLTVATTGATTATVGTSAGLFAGQPLLVGTGSTQELISVSNVVSSTSITAYFANTHSLDPVLPIGVFAQGVTPSTNGQVSSSSTQYTGNAIWLYGDLLGNGTVTLVEYSCPTKSTALYTDSSGNLWGPLVRTEYDNVLTGNTTPNTPMYLLDLMEVNSSGCFTLATNAVPVINTANVTNTFKYVTSVSISLTAMAAVLNTTGTSVTPLYDPDTHQTVTASRSFLNIQPRNIVAAYNYALYCNNELGITNNESVATPTVINSLLN